MREDIRQLEQDRQLPWVEEEYETQLEAHFDLIQRGDYISPGRWHWRCRRETSDGEVAYGYVEADSLGGAVAPDTFENDRR